MVDLKDRLAKDADTLLLDELMHLTDAQFDEVMKQLMIELRVEPRKVRNKSTYYFAEVVSTKDQNREIMFVNKGTGMIGQADVEKLATYSEKIRAPRSTLINLGDISSEADKEGRRRSVRLIRGTELASLIRKSGLEDLVLKEFAQDAVSAQPVAPVVPAASIERQTLTGEELMQAGDLVRALEYFDRAIAVDPESEAAWRLKGSVLEQLGYHAKALECFARALEINPKSAELWYAIGAAMYSVGRYEDEVQAYDKALQLDPNLEKAWAGRGATLLKLRRYPEALSSFDRLLKINPRLVKAHTNRGLALKNLNRMQDALNAFDAAISLDMDFAEAWSNKGSLLIQTGRLSEALVCFAHLVVLRPEMSQAWKTKGELESRLGKRSEAIASFEKALELDPTDSELLKTIEAEKAKIHAEQADLRMKISSLFSGAGVKLKPEPIVWEEPKEEIRKAVAREEKPVPTEPALEAAIESAEASPEVAGPGPAGTPAGMPAAPEEGLVLEPEGIGEPLVGVAEEVFGDAAELMLLMKRPEMALDEIEKGLRLEPLSIRMMLLKGIALYQVNKKDEAIKAFVRATELDQGNEEGIYSIEYLLSSDGKYIEAEEALEPLLGGNRWAPEILAAMDSAAAGKMKRVEEHMEVAISLSPSAMAWNYKGLLDLDQGDFEKAVHAFERAKELEEVFSDPSNNTGVAYFKLGSIDDASNWYDQAISTHPRNWIAWTNRGVLLASQDRQKEALACFDQALMLEKSPQVLLNKGFALLSTDALDDAMQAFDASLTIKETAEGYNDKGIALARMNRFNDAVEYFKKALRLSPKFEDAQENLDRYEPMMDKGKKGKERKVERAIELPFGTSDKIWKELGPLDEHVLNKKKKPELSEICEALGLSPEGIKKELVDRILSAYLGHKLDEELDDG
jgi:tetratricopeptide (TPR) repeat protein